VVAAGVFLAFHVVGAGRYSVTGDSMAPTLERGTTVTVSTVSGGNYTPKRGDIVVFHPPQAWGGGSGSRALRVIGMPGETVSSVLARDGTSSLTVNGKPLDEPYLKKAGGPVAWFVVKVPAGRVWLLGDNRAAAADSHTVYLGTHDATAATVPTSAVTSTVTR
jgi:signal peptidase I